MQVLSFGCASSKSKISVYDNVQVSDEIMCAHRPPFMTRPAAEHTVASLTVTQPLAAVKMNELTKISESLSFSLLIVT